MKTNTTLNTLKNVKLTFRAKDSDAQVFELYLNERGDDQVFISGCLHDVTIAMCIIKDVSNILRTKYFLFDAVTANHLEVTYDLPEHADISRNDLIEEAIKVLGHSMSTVGWYKHDCRVKEVWRTICLHMDSVMKGYGIKLNMFRDCLDM